MSVKQRMTAEDLIEMPDAPGKRYELVKGLLIEMGGTGVLHGYLVELILRLIGAYSREHRLGLVFADNVGYVITHDPDTVRIPDVSFVARARIPEGRLPRGYWPFAPDLAVEIVSPGDSATELRAKVRQYLEAGTRLVWVVWPDEESVTVYPIEDPPAEIGPDGDLDGGEVLPGFHVPVSELFRQEY